jgi:cysteinyl-tRNA synthetase
MAAGCWNRKSAGFVRQVINDKMRFLEMMDDDFNTAGAIAVMHEMAGSINSFLEQNRAEADRQPDVIQAAPGRRRPCAGSGRFWGCFRTELPGLRAKEPGTVGPAHALLIQLRNDARKSKQFRHGRCRARRIDQTQHHAGRPPRRHRLAGISVGFGFCVDRRRRLE